MSDVEIRALRDADEPAVLALLQASLGGGPTGSRTTEFFRWKHRANPFGSSLGLVAAVDDDIVGVRLLLRWELRLGARRLQAVRMVDTATAPAWQGRGIFRTLTLQALEQATARGQADLAFNTPNAQSRPGYLKMGWSTAGSLPVSFRVVRAGAVLRALSAGGLGQQGVVGAPAPVNSDLLPAAPFLRDRAGEVDALLLDAESARPAGRLTTARTPEYLCWRYGSAPGLDYRAVPVEDGGRLVGLGLGRLRRRGPLAELTLGEVLVRPGDTRSARRVLVAAARGGADIVTALLPNASLAASCGFLRAPRQGLTLTSRAQGPLPVDVTSAASWQLSLGDLELF